MPNWVTSRHSLLLPVFSPFCRPTACCVPPAASTTLFSPPTPLPHSLPHPVSPLLQVNSQRAAAGSDQDPNANPDFAAASSTAKPRVSLTGDSASPLTRSRQTSATPPVAAPGGDVAGNPAGRERQQSILHGLARKEDFEYVSDDEEGAAAAAAAAEGTTKVRGLFFHLGSYLGPYIAPI